VLCDIKTLDGMEGLPPHTDDQKMREFNWNIGRKEKEKHRT
jgi:hypothetical protein